MAEQEIRQSRRLDQARRAHEAGLNVLEAAEAVREVWHGPTASDSDAELWGAIDDLCIALEVQDTDAHGESS